MLANVVVVQVDVGAWSPARYPGKAARGNLPDMPFKFNAAHRHRIPKPRYRVRNWSEYEAGLKRRGNLMLWVDEAAILGWQAPRRTTPGGQARYSDLAIQLVLTLRLVFTWPCGKPRGFYRQYPPAAWARSAHSGPHHLEPA